MKEQELPRGSSWCLLFLLFCWGGQSLTNYGFSFGTTATQQNKKEREVSQDLMLNS